MKSNFDSEVELNDILEGLDNSAANNENSPSPRAEREDPKQKSDGSSPENTASSANEGSQPGSLAAIYNGFQQPRTPW